MKKIVLFFVALIFLGVLIFVFNISPTSLSGEKTRFVVPIGAKQDEIINQLKEEKYIRSKKLFSIFSPIMRFPGNVEPGAYMLSRNMTLFSIIDTLFNHPYQKWVLVKPGLRREQTAEVMAEKMGWTDDKKKDFLANAQEGYMFPDTYLINVDFSGKEAAEKLISNFNEKFDQSIINGLLANNIRNDTAIKIASLIQRESGGDSDKALIAGIIINRLNQGMRLQIDASIQYEKGVPGNWWPKITLADYKLDSEYNTYLIKRLPPTPICSPGLSSIKAVANPETTDCIFYLHDHDGNIHCSVTYSEHLQNIEEYLK
jgi:UPF0755 protein